jgi:mannose-6-phosphate isomerase-like protein (cupin superfamily)
MTDPHKPAADPTDRTRRQLLAGAAGWAAATAARPVHAGGSVPGEATGARRVVAIRDASGRDRILADGPSPARFELNGTTITRLWETTAGSAYREGFQGTSFYIAEIPPGVGRGQIAFHRTETLDYMAILRGEVHYLLPDRELHLRQGDTVVQAGVEHSWENRGTEPCWLLFAVVAGRAGPA